MKINIQTLDFKVKPELFDYLNEKVEKLARFQLAFLLQFSLI